MLYEISDIKGPQYCFMCINLLLYPKMIHLSPMLYHCQIRVPIYQPSIKYISNDFVQPDFVCDSIYTRSTHLCKYLGCVISKNYLTKTIV